MARPESAKGVGASTPFADSGRATQQKYPDKPLSPMRKQGLSVSLAGASGYDRGISSQFVAETIISIVENLLREPPSATHH